MSQLLRSMNDQARGGARLSADDATTYVHEPDDGSTTASMATDHAAGTLTSTEVTAAVGDVRLTIRSSKSPLSENPLGPSASSGMAWAAGRTHTPHTTSATLMTQRAVLIASRGSIRQVTGSRPDGHEIPLHSTFRNSKGPASQRPRDREALGLTIPPSLLLRADQVIE